MKANKDIVARDDLAMLDPDGVFPARLADDRAALVALLSEMRGGAPEACEERLKRIATLSHRLAGAAGTFGYAEVSDAALALEELIVDAPNGSGWRKSISEAADALVGALDEAVSGQKQSQRGDC